MVIKITRTAEADSMTAVTHCTAKNYIMHCTAIYYFKFTD